MSKSIFETKWIKEMKSKLMFLHKDWDEEKVEKELENILWENLKDVPCEVINTYKCRKVDSTLLNMMQFIHDMKPIIGGFGVLYKNQNECRNPSAGMLLSDIKKRNILKGERKQFDKRSREFLMLDIAQGNQKVIANSEYGASGAPSSYFYNLHLATSTTATGQAEISTAQTSFEALIAGNYIFLDEDEFLLYIIRATKKSKYKHKLPKVPNVKEECLERYLNNFLKNSEKRNNFVIRVLDKLSEEELTKLYFKNNLLGLFTYNKDVRKLLSKLINETASFRDPNSIPEDIKDDLEELWEYVEEFSVHNYPIRNRIERDKFLVKEACIVQDTDSTMVTLYLLYAFLDEEFTKNDRASKTDSDHEFILVNIISYLLTRYCQLFLKRYCTDVNIPESYHWCINMKNEFFYPKLVTTNAKKHYLTLTKLQEGKEIVPPKIESHGMEYIKSNTSDNTKKFFEDIVQEDIMYSDDIDVPTIVRKVDAFGDMIMDSLDRGSMEFLPMLSVKEPEAYKAPLSEQGIRAVNNWNVPNEDKKINLPDKVYLVKLICEKEKDFEEMKGIIDDDKYQLIMDKIFHCDNKDISKHRYDVIAIPQNHETIPEWIIPMINKKKIIEDNLSKFNSILESLGEVSVKAKANSTFVCNIIDT